MPDRMREIFFERVYLTLKAYQHTPSEENYLRFCVLYDLIIELELEEDYCEWREEDVEV